MSSIQIFAPHRHHARAHALDLDCLEQFDPARDGTGSPVATRFGVILFWTAVACLLLARVVLFDPSATRMVGSFPDQVAPAFHAR